jgi:hypothetical protein
MYRISTEKITAEFVKDVLKDSQNADLICEFDVTFTNGKSGSIWKCQSQKMSKLLSIVPNYREMKLCFTVEIHRSQETKDDYDMIDDEFELKYGYTSRSFDDLELAIEYYNSVPFMIS